MTWKSQLMAGDLDPAIAAQLGTILAEIHDQAPDITRSRAFSPTRACLMSSASTPITEPSRGPIPT